MSTSTSTDIADITERATATVFLIAEGIFPDREGRARKLRSIIRHAVDVAERAGKDPGYFGREVERVAFHYRSVSLKIHERWSTIEEVVRLEVESYLHLKGKAHP